MIIDVPELGSGPARDFLLQQGGLAAGAALCGVLVLGLLLGAFFFGGRKRQIQRLKAANQALEMEKQRLLERLATPPPPASPAPAPAAARNTAGRAPLLAPIPARPPAASGTAATADKGARLTASAGKDWGPAEDEIPADPPTVKMPAPTTLAAGHAPSPAPETVRLQPRLPATAAPATRVLRQAPAAASPPPPPAPSAVPAATPAAPKTSPAPRLFPPAPPAPELAAAKMAAAPVTPPVFAAQPTPTSLLPEEERQKVDSLLQELRHQAAAAKAPAEPESGPGCEPFTFLLEDVPAAAAPALKSSQESPHAANLGWQGHSTGFLLDEEEKTPAGLPEAAAPLAPAVQPPADLARLASALGSIRAPSLPAKPPSDTPPGSQA